MNTITRIDMLFQDPSSQPPKKASPYDQALAELESFIDKMVTAENNISKTNTKTAIQQAQLLEEYETKVAFLSGQIHRAESALTALEGSVAQASAAAASQNPGLDSKIQEILYWKARLQQVVESNEMNHDL